jgi:hypothetical protein
MATVTISDETIAGSRTRALELEFSSGTITVRELIASRVEEEVRRHNAQFGEVFHGLVQPSDSERILNGYRMKQRRAIVPESQVERALEAFERNGFFVLVGERQAESLDEEITIGLETPVSFVKLLPLVGG